VPAAYKEGTVPPNWSRQAQPGFSLVELVIAMALGLLILVGAVALFRQGVDISYTVTQRADMQQNARTAVNLMARDLTVAGAALPPGGGIGLPKKTPPLAPSQRPRRACPIDTAADCGNLGGYPGDMLYYVTPGDGMFMVNGVPTDVVTIVFMDETLNLGETLENIEATASGTRIIVRPGDVAAINDPATGLKQGDVVLVWNQNGPAIGLVTHEPSGGNDFRLTPGSRDRLNFNHPGGSVDSGNIAFILDPPSGPTIPDTSAARIYIVSYFLDASNPGNPRLMRQVNAAAAAPMAENIDNLQITYDIIDNSGLVSAGLSNIAPASPAQIRKVNLELMARAPARGLFRRGFDRVTLRTSLSIRNLTYSDPYK
jgi:prepilin-type N-terminal cleavage/methylation domain-containing protein